MKLKAIIGIVFILLVMIAACQSDKQVEFNRYYSAGSVLYQSHCQNCHGQHGEGLMALIPPFTDTVYLKTNKAALACAVKYGLKGKIALAGKIFEGTMPANNLSAVEIAEVLTYITNSFGNKMGTITSQTVDSSLTKCVALTQ